MLSFDALPQQLCFYVYWFTCTEEILIKCQHSSVLVVDRAHSDGLNPTVVLNIYENNCLFIPVILFIVQLCMIVFSSLL
jgi:hypothetical protein